MAPNPQQMLKQVQKMQADMARATEELAGESVEASAGGGAVKVTMSGALQVTKVDIDPAAVDPDDVDMLQDMVEAAVNEALRMAQELASAKMARITGGMNIPGLF
jgi:DNA-binding YbaB/EbfC family protein